MVTVVAPPAALFTRTPSPSYTYVRAGCPADRAQPVLGVVCQVVRAAPDHPLGHAAAAIVAVRVRSHRRCGVRQAAAAFRAAHFRGVAQRLPALAAQHPRLRLVAVAFQSNVAPCSPAGCRAGQAVCRIIREALHLRAARRG